MLQGPGAHADPGAAHQLPSCGHLACPLFLCSHLLRWLRSTGMVRSSWHWSRSICSPGSGMALFFSPFSLPLGPWNVLWVGKIPSKVNHLETISIRVFVLAQLNVVSWGPARRRGPSHRAIGLYSPASPDSGESTVMWPKVMPAYENFCDKISQFVGKRLLFLPPSLHRFLVVVPRNNPWPPSLKTALKNFPCSI